MARTDVHPAADPPEPPRPVRSRLVRPWLAHLQFIVPALLLLDSVSTPGLMVNVALIAGAALLVGAIVWIVWVVVLMFRRRMTWWIPVAPRGAVLVLGLIVADVPLKARWGASQDSFIAQVASLPASVDGDDDDDGWFLVDVAPRIGLYRVTGRSEFPAASCSMRLTVRSGKTQASPTFPTDRPRCHRGPS